LRLLDSISNLERKLCFANTAKASDCNLVLAARLQKKLFKLIKLFIPANETLIPREGNISKNTTAICPIISGILVGGKLLTGF
jgi:hypothetical protein